MKNSRKTRIMAVLVALVFTFGATGIGIASNQFTQDLQASLIRITKAKNGKGRIVKLLESRLVAQEESDIQETVSCFFEEPKSVEYRGEAINRENTLYVEKGDEFSASFYYLNSGTVPWFGEASNCANQPTMYLGTAKTRDHTSIFFNPADSQWKQPSRIKMVESRVNPGEMATFTFNSRSPNLDDIFKEYFQPVVEGTAWLDSSIETASFILHSGAPAEDLAAHTKYLGMTGQVSGLDLTGEPVVDVDLSEQKVQIKFGNTVIREYRVSTGAPRTPTPQGRFKIMSKQELRIGGKAPHYRMPFFQMITKSGVGFHALPYLASDKGVFWKEALNHIGQPVSHGCIRLLDEDALDLHNLTEIGWPVVIHS